MTARSVRVRLISFTELVSELPGLAIVAVLEAFISPGTPKVGWNGTHSIDIKAKPTFALKRCREMDCAAISMLFYPVTLIPIGSDQCKGMVGNQTDRKNDFRKPPRPESRTRSCAIPLG